jgi:hypothetical protein
VLAAASALSTPLRAQAASLRESFGNFPEAVQIEAEFGNFSNLAINGESVSGTGFWFRVTNNSFGSGGSSAFAVRPDSHFSDHKVLTPAAAQVLAEAQPYGLYAFDVHLPSGAGARISAPSGFEVDFEDEEESAEISFRIDLARAAGLLFDERAPRPSALFGTPRFGTLDFFVSTRSGRLEDNLIDEDSGRPALDVSTQLAWIDAGRIQTHFHAPYEAFDGRRLRPRGELVPATNAVPEPGTGLACASGLVWLALLGRARRARSPRQKAPLRDHTAPTVLSRIHASSTSERLRM